MVAQATPGTQFDVGGILLEQPFKIRRLGHFGFNVVDMDEPPALLHRPAGFRISDELDFAKRAADPSGWRASATPTATSCAMAAITTPSCCSTAACAKPLDKTRRFKPGVTINQITWQVRQPRRGRDAPPSGSPSRACASSAPAATCPARTGTPISTTPTATPTSCTTASSRSAGTATASRGPMYERGFHQPPDAAADHRSSTKSSRRIARGIDLAVRLPLR